MLESGKGKHNLWHMLLLFLQHVKLNSDAALRSVSLGSSGLNLLWVLED